MNNSFPYLIQLTLPYLLKGFHQLNTIKPNPIFRATTYCPVCASDKLQNAVSSFTCETCGVEKIPFEFFLPIQIFSEELHRKSSFDSVIDDDLSPDESGLHEIQLREVGTDNTISSITHHIGHHDGDIDGVQEASVGVNPLATINSKK